MGIALTMRLLLTEDDAELAQSLIERFRDQGYEVVHVGDGHPGSARGHRVRISMPSSLIACFPVWTGWSWSRRCGEHKATPIIYLTTMSGIDDRVRGLEAGGDDYLIKPFAFEELLARIRVMTRRLAPLSSKLYAGSIEMDLVQRTVTRGGHAIELLPQEFRLLEYLCATSTAR